MIVNMIRTSTHENPDWVWLSMFFTLSVEECRYTFSNQLQRLTRKVRPS